MTDPVVPDWERAVLEKVALQALEEQRRARQWKVLFRLLWFAFAFLILAAWLGWIGRPDKELEGTTIGAGKHTALVELEGVIAPESKASSERMIKALNRAFKDRNTQGVVVRINSPGGSPVQAGYINDEIRRLRAKYPNTPVYAVVEEMCASGAYYIAVAADEIYVDKASLVGSIGVLMDGFGFPAAMDKLGIERRLLTAGENKGMLDPFSPQNEKHKAYAQAMIDQIHQQFIKVVKDGRGKRLQEDGNTFSGLFWNGEEAVRQGLADKFGNLDYVAREVVKAEEVIDYTPKENIAERLAKRFGSSIGEGAVRALRALTPLR